MTRDEEVAALSRTYGDPADGVIVRFQLEWTGTAKKHHRSTMTDEEFAAYEGERIAAMQYVGEHARHFERPFESWTADDIDRLVADMLATLRATPVRRRHSLCERVYISVNRFNGINQKHDSLRMFICGENRDFRAEVDLRRPVNIPTAALAEWVTRADPYQCLVKETARGMATEAQTYKPEGWCPESVIAAERADRADDDARSVAGNATDDEDDDGEDDDAEDTENRLILRIVRDYMQPAATWADVRPYVHLMRTALLTLGPDKGSR